MFKNLFFHSITFVFAFVLTFSHVTVLNSLDNDFSLSPVSFVNADLTPESMEESEQDEAPEHLNSIVFTDFMNLHTYSLQIHAIDLKSSKVISSPPIYSDSFFSDILRPPISV